MHASGRGWERRSYLKHEGVRGLTVVVVGCGAGSRLRGCDGVGQSQEHSGHIAVLAHSVHHRLRV